MTDINDCTELMQLTQEAFKLASTACHFDNLQNYVGACDYYDKCILNMDEVLNKLPPDSTEWKRLYDIRSKYDDRMELLRENDNSNSFSLTSLAGGKTETRGSTFRITRNRRKLADAETDFKDIDWNDSLEESAPDDSTEATYWLLRNFRKTMEHGGFLTKDIFIPKRIWMQNDVKFSGLGAKSAAPGKKKRCWALRVELWAHKKAALHIMQRQLHAAPVAYSPLLDAYNAALGTCIASLGA